MMTVEQKQREEFLFQDLKEFFEANHLQIQIPGGAIMINLEVIAHFLFARQEKREGRQWWVDGENKRRWEEAVKRDALKHG